MPVNGSLPRDHGLRIWPEIRCAFIEREVKPTWEELSEEFRVAQNTIVRCASDEGWPLQRSRFLEAALQKADVSQSLLALAQDRRETTSAIANLVLVGVRRLTREIEKMPDDQKPRATMDMLGTAFFAAANAAKALKEVGIAQIPKELADGLGGSSSAGKDFLKSALQQINVSVNVAAGKAEVAPKPADVTELPE